MKNKNINPGFKPSPIGSIPNDWEVSTIEKLFNITAGGDIDKVNVSKEKNETFQYPIFANADRNSGLYGYSDLYKIDFDCITVSGRGEIGIAKARFEKFYPIVRLLILKPQTTVDLIFYENYINKINIHQESTGVPQLTAPQIAKYKIAFPPLSEQQKIAAILSTWDEAISKTQQLINQLKERNRGLQQKLLTGKKRLKGFNGEWTYFPLHKYAKELSLKNINNKELIVLSCTKYNGLVSSLEYFGKQMFSKDVSTYKIVPKNCFAYATNHIEEGSIGLQLNYEEALISPMYTVFKTDISLFDNTFLYKVFKSHNYIHEYQKRMEGSIDRRGGLRWDEFSKIKIPVISLDEQRAMLNILNQSDNEVKIQEQKLETLKHQKKGLMQKLLTGKIRVKIE